MHVFDLVQMRESYPFGAAMRRGAYQIGIARGFDLLELMHHSTLCLACLPSYVAEDTHTLFQRIINQVIIVLQYNSPLKYVSSEDSH